MTPPPPRSLSSTPFTPPYPSPPHPPLLSLIAAAFSFLSLLKPNHQVSSPLRRRSRRLTLYPMHPPPPPPLSFSSPDSLSSFLTPRLPSDSFSSWGSAPGTKTVHNLFLEISHGETSILLANEIPIRTVHVAAVNIRNSRGSVLIESRQLLSDGSTRERSRPLSEKMKPGETIDQAVERAVKEELGESVIVRLMEGSGEVRVEERESGSYPGLIARYVLHSIEVKLVEGLPDEGEFETEETGEDELDEGNGGKAITVKKHYWKWVDDYQVQQ